MEPGAAAGLWEVGGGVVLPVEHPLGGEQALDAHGAPGVDPRRADADLGAQAEPEAVGEARACVVEDASAVHFALELFGFVGWKNYILWS